MTVNKITKDGKIICNIDGKTTVDIDSDQFDPDVYREELDDVDIAVEEEYEVLIHMSGEARATLFHHNNHITQSILMDKGIHPKLFDWDIIQVNTERKTGKFRLWDLNERKPIEPAEYFLREGKYEKLDLKPFERTVLKTDGQTCLDRFAGEDNDE